MDDTRRVFSQTPILPNGSTYLMLSKLRDQMQPGKLPTCKIEFDPAQLDYNDNDLGDSIDGLKKPSNYSISSSSSPGNRGGQQFGIRFSSPVHASREGKMKDEQERNLQTGQPAIKPRATSAQPANVNAGSSNTKAGGARTVSIKSRHRKIRDTTIGIDWYSAIVNGTAATTPPRNMTPQPKLGCLYLQHLSATVLDNPTIWIWTAGADGRNHWVKIEKNHRYEGPGSDQAERFLVITKGGKPSWNKRLNGASGAVHLPDQDESNDEGEDDDDHDDN